MKISPVGAEMLHEGGRTDRHDEAIAPKTKHVLKISLMRNRLEMDTEHDGTLYVQNSKCM
jgi:hypothetical protein